MDTTGQLILQGNCDTQLYYRPNLLQTARYLEERLGMSSGYSRSTTLRHGEAASEALSERPIPLLASQDIGLMTDEEVIAWHRNYRPLKLKRMSWREHPVLVARRNMKPPKVWPLPPLKEVTLQEPATVDDQEIHLDDPDNLVDPDAMN